MSKELVYTLVLLKIDQNWHSLVDVRATGTRMDSSKNERRKSKILG